MIVRFMLREGNVYANESPSLCVVTTFGLSLTSFTLLRGSVVASGEKQLPWSTASARGKRGPSLAGTLVTSAGRPGTDD